MNTNKRNFWLSLCVFNLFIVAVLGFLLRSKILFPIPFLDYRNLLSSHSYFAFSGWAGLALITLMIFDILPQQFQQRKLYLWVLAGIELSSLGMGVFYPFFGYNFITLVFSVLYLVAILIFVPVFISDLSKSTVHKNVKLLSVSALVSLILSFAGVAGLAYVLLARAGGMFLYRDSMYVFLHFQYNGFFTLAVFALFANYLLKKGILPDKNGKFFALFLCLSAVPALFLSLLWHNNTLYYVIAAIGSLFILIALFYFYKYVTRLPFKQIIKTKLARQFYIFSLVSFGLKMFLQVGTLIPELGNAVFGDRPVIIGFLHLAFLGILTFFILAVLTEDNFFTRGNKIIALPLVIFTIGIFLNELLLMLQGLGILLNTNDDIYKWLLWITSIVLLVGALMLFLARLSVVREGKKAQSQS